MKVVFVTDFIPHYEWEERIHTYLPACTAVLRPDWDISIYWLQTAWDKEDPISRIISQYGGQKPITNFYSQYENVLDDTGDLLVFLCAVPNSNAAVNKILTKISTLRGRFKTIAYISLDCWYGWFMNKHVVDSEKQTYSIAEVEGNLIHASDFLFAVSPQLCKWLGVHYKVNKPIFWLPNGADLRKYKTDTPPYVGEKLVAVYIGFWSAHRFSGWKETLRDVARAFPHIYFYVIGGKWHTEIVNSFYGNLYFLDHTPLSAGSGFGGIRSFLRNASFCLVLQGRNPFGYFADPTKWYVYHAAGRPILSMNTPHHALFPSFYPNTVCCSDLHKGIEEIERRLRAGAFNLEVKEEHDWLHRANAFISAIERGEAIYGRAQAGKWESGW